MRPRAPGGVDRPAHGQGAAQEPAEAPAESNTDGTRGSTHTATTSTSPLLRSGLVLAGANSGGQDDENGFLSAAELINMDLRGTELVVLSACETGIGEVQIGEGVQGLSKALQVAGSDTQVLSLWKVSDEATQILMQEFYSRLIDGVGRGEALRQAKAALREDPRFGHPFYWAAFVLSGDWRPLDSELGKPSLWERWRERHSEG